LKDRITSDELSELLAIRRLAARLLGELEALDIYVA
jgi:hypothetical protein